MARMWFLQVAHLEGLVNAPTRYCLEVWPTCNSIAPARSSSPAGEDVYEARIIRDAEIAARGRLGIERSAGARRRVTATKIKWWNLIPAASAVPAAPAKQQNDKYDDEKRGGIHVRNSSWECVCTATTTNPFDPYPFL